MAEHDDPEKINVSEWIPYVRKSVAVLRALGLGSLVSAVKSHVIFNTVRILHVDVMHSLREFARCLPGDNGELTAIRAQEMCSAFAKSMRVLLELSPNEMHCCYKVIASIPDEQGEFISTLARSEPYDDRPVETEAANIRPVSESTVFAALMGRSDGQYGWRPFKCFSCNDLLDEGASFRCGRSKWQNYYRSVLVFPLRYVKSVAPLEVVTIGFLAFDSPKKHAFRGLPNIFKFKDETGRYMDKLSTAPAFHLGALFADTLSMALRRAYDPAMTEGEPND
jgi:hypothetical protein